MLEEPEAVAVVFGLWVAAFEELGLGSDFLSRPAEGWTVSVPEWDFMSPVGGLVGLPCWTML